MEKTILVTVSDDRYGRKGGKYAETQNKIKSFFSENPNLGITDFYFTDWNDIIKTQFYIDHKELLDQPDPAMNGRCYKPFAISEGLKLIENGDFLIYNDVSPEMWKIIEDPSFNHSSYNIKVIKNLCVKNGGILTGECVWSIEDSDGVKTPNLHTHENFTLDRCMETMGLLEYKFNIQHAGGLMVLQKNEESVAFIDEWIHWNTNPECCSLGPIGGPQTYWHGENGTKIGHRHDQSISSLLISKYNKKLLRGLSTFCFLECCLNKPYSFIDSHQEPGRYRYIYDYTQNLIIKIIR